VSQLSLQHCASLAFPNGPPSIPDLPTCIKHLKDSYSSLKQLQIDHKLHQQSHLEQLAEAIAIHKATTSIGTNLTYIPPTTTEKTLRLLMKREHIRQVHRKIGFLLRGSSPPGSNRIDIPDPSTPNQPSHGNPDDPKT
jgi:hypothetical protein